MAANLVSNVLKADGVVLVTVFGGLAQVDLGLVGQACEEYGVKTNILVHMALALPAAPQRRCDVSSGIADGGHQHGICGRTRQPAAQGGAHTGRYR